jgi:hypothetical protein
MIKIIKYGFVSYIVKSGLIIMFKVSSKHKPPLFNQLLMDLKFMSC